MELAWAGRKGKQAAQKQAAQPLPEQSFQSSNTLPPDMPRKREKKTAQKSATEADPEQHLDSSAIPPAVIPEAQENTPTLLGIAPELRNRIYYAALTRPKLLDVNNPAFQKQPALLSVCRQIRTESIAIYYTDNNFDYECCKLEGSKVLPFCELQKKYRVDHKVKLQTVFCEHPSYFDYQNLWAWLEAYHKDEQAPRPPNDSKVGKRRSKKFVLQAFDLIDLMRRSQWSTVRLTLGPVVETAMLHEDFRNPMDDEEDFQEMMAELGEGERIGDKYWKIHEKAFF